jgi:hypothetical protein
MALPIAAAVGGVLINITASIVGRVLVALGLGVATYVGVDVALNFLKSEALVWINQLPANLIAMLALMKIGVSLNIIFSATVARMAINGFQSGTFRRWTLGG